MNEPLTHAATPQMASNPRRPVRRRTFRSVFNMTAALVILNIVWRTVRYALGFPIWGDEAFVAVNFLERDFRGMIDPLVYGQIAPLGFMWAELAVTRLLGLSEWALRLLPYLTGVLSMLLFWRFAARTVSRRTALLAVGFLAASYYPVRHAAEIKPYSTDLLVSLALSSVGWALYQRPRSVARWSALVLLAAVSVWCSYPAVFVAGAVGLLLARLLLATRSRAVLAGCAIYSVVLSASFLAMFWWYARPHAAAAARLAEIQMWTQTFPPIEQPWKLPLWLIGIHTGNMLAYPLGGKNGGSALTCLLVVIGCAALWKRRGALLLLLLGPLPLTLAAAAMKRYPYGGTVRTSLYLAPAFCLLAAVGVNALLRRYLPRRQRLRGLAIAAGVMGAITIGGSISDIVRPYKTFAARDNRRVVRWLAEQTAPGDRWVVFNSLDPAIEYAPYLGAWRGDGAPFVFYVKSLAPGPAPWAPPPDSLAAQSDGRTWLIAYHAAKAPFPQEQFDAYVAAVRARLGAPHRHWFPFERRGGTTSEAIEVLEFARLIRPPARRD